MKKTFIILLFSIILTIFMGCTTDQFESTFLSDLNEAGFSITSGIDLDGNNYQEQILHYNELFDSINVTFENIFTFEDEFSMDYGYIYQINDPISISEFFQNRKDYSFLVNEIVFLYLVDNYVLEVYHATESTFPGFLRHYTFEANYQYYLHYASDLIYHPLITQFLDSDTYIDQLYSDSDIINLRRQFNDINVSIEKAFDVIDTNIHFNLIGITTSNMNDAVVIYENQTVYFPGSGNLRMFIQYQNIVLIVTYTYGEELEILNEIMGEVSFLMYHEADLIE